MDIQLKSPLDMHVHLREGEMLRYVAPFTAEQFAGAVAMPNLLQPVNTAERLREYRKRIIEATGSIPFEPYMTLFMRDFSYVELEEIRREIIGVKLYPDGITTQSEGGVKDFEAVERILAMMQELQIPLLVHGETHGFVLEREAEFLELYERWAKSFPRLRIVMEHLTDSRSLKLLERYENLRATVTLHHLFYTLDDVIGGALNPFLFCKPVVKTPRDRAALREFVLKGHPQVFFGSDSAPHTRQAKLERGAAGVFSAPVALPLLTQFFEENGALHNLSDFVSYNARVAYGIEPVERTVTLIRQSWEVPSQYGEVVPMFAGKTINWSVLS